jgi:hypothetical protein
MIKQIIILNIIITAISFGKPLSEKATEVDSIYNELLRVNSIDNEKKYISVFPDNFADFMEIFQPVKLDQLYNEYYKYIDKFFSLLDKYPAEITRITCLICCNAKWEADATGNLRQGLTQLITKFPKIFLIQYQSMNIQCQNGILNFFADFETVGNSKEYQNIINLMIKNNAVSISNKMIKYRKIQAKKYDDDHSPEIK